MGDVSTDSDWWGNSATPWSLAGGHGLIRLDELHWHLSYLNDCTNLSISPLFPLRQPLALLSNPPKVHAHALAGGHRSGRVRRSSGRDLRVFTAGGHLASRSKAPCRSKWKYFSLTTDGEWLTKAALCCQRSKHHTNRNTPVATRVTVKVDETSVHDNHLNEKGTH